MNAEDDALKANYLRERCEDFCRHYPGVRVEAVVRLERGGFGVILAVSEGWDGQPLDVKPLARALEKLADVSGVYMQLHCCPRTPRPDGETGLVASLLTGIDP